LLLSVEQMCKALWRVAGLHRVAHYREAATLGEAFKVGDNTACAHISADGT
jgi:hypothetical protein